LSLRVLHVQDHTVPEMSGYAFRSRYLVENQARLGIRPEVVSSARHRNFESLVEEPAGFPIHRTPWPGGILDRLQLAVPFWRERVLTRTLARRVIEVGRAFQPQIIHAHSPIFDGQAALRAGRALGVPVVYEIRAFWEDDAVDKQKFREGSFVYRQVRRIETDVCRRADAVVTICEGLKNDLCDRGIDEDKIVVVQNGVDGDRFCPQEPDQALRRRLGLDGATVAGFVGSFFHYEGLPLFVEAAAEVRKTHPELTLLLVGGGEDEERVRAAVQNAGVEDMVVMTGRVPHEEVGGHYSLMDVLVYPRLSRRITELATPLKPLEAFAMEKAVIGSDVGGIRELLRDIPAGRLFRAGSVPELSQALRDWLSVPESERALEATRSRELVRTRHAWGSLLEPLLERYGRLAGASGPG